MNSISVLLILFPLCGTAKYSQEWSYSNEDAWPDKYCKKGIWQSPIDLAADDENNTIHISGPNLSFEKLNQVYDATVRNDGHKVRIFLDFGNITVSGGRLPGIYRIDHIGIHWNSAHTLHGERKALELNFLWCNIRFENCDEAERYKNGQALLSTLYEFQDQDNKILDPVIKSLDKIREPNSMFKIKLNPRSLLPNDLKKFYRYLGSFTRPDCSEGKIWTIFKEFCKVSQNQVSQFMKLKGEDGKVLKKTYRNTQDLNQRIIFKMTTS